MLRARKTWSSFSDRRADHPIEAFAVVHLTVEIWIVVAILLDAALKRAIRQLLRVGRCQRQGHANGFEFLQISPEKEQLFPKFVECILVVPETTTCQFLIAY